MEIEDKKLNNDELFILKYIKAFHGVNPEHGMSDENLYKSVLGSNLKYFTFNLEEGIYGILERFYWAGMRKVEFAKLIKYFVGKGGKERFGKEFWFGRFIKELKSKEFNFNKFERLLTKTEEKNVKRSKKTRSDGKPNRKS